MTRKEEVLRYLRQHVNEWVNGPEIANAEVGGSEGLKRLRELRDDGHAIIARRHPNPNRDVWQYMLRGPKAMPKPEPVPIQTSASTRLKYNPDSGKYDVVARERPELPQPNALEDQEPDGYRFITKPEVIEFGSTLHCPRCHAKTKTVDDLYQDPDRRPKENKPCRRCNGFGIVPNQGPIPRPLEGEG